MVELTKNDTTRAVDNKFWTWAQKVIDRYGVDGMSSDESEVDEHSGGRKTVLRAKYMFWRRNIENIVKLIESTKTKNRQLFSQRGPQAFLRIRPDYDSPGNVPKTNRPAAENLPYHFYDATWFHSLSSNVRQSVLHATNEPFEWLQASELIF